MVKSINKLRPKFSTHADGSDAVLFIHELVGETDGPTVGISASIHGNENTGSQAILELFRLLKDMPIKGRILLLPVANPRSFAVNHRHNPLDQLNLNREFPGDDRGTYSQQLAFALARDYFDKIDANIDLHSGTDRPTVDYVYIWSDEGLSRAFGSKLLYRPTEGKTGTLYAGTTKTVTIDRRPEMKVVTIELGGGIRHCFAILAGDQHMHVGAERFGRAERLGGRILKYLVVVLGDQKRGHYSTPASSLSLPTSSATDATLAPDLRPGGSVVLSTCSRGVMSTP